jgi:hypothetical protein
LVIGGDRPLIAQVDLAATNPPKGAEMYSYQLAKLLADQHIAELHRNAAAHRRPPQVTEQRIRIRRSRRRLARIAIASGRRLAGVAISAGQQR